MALETLVAIVKEAAEKVAEKTIEAMEKEIQELPEEIGELSEIEMLPEEIGDELKPNTIYEADGVVYETDDKGEIVKVDNQSILGEEAQGISGETNKINEIKDSTDLSDTNDGNEINDGNEKQDNPHQETVDGVTNYYDDNGNIYRTDNNLAPNSEYELNGYKYKTDDQGRIISAEGKLHLKDREGRLPIKDSIDDIGKGDQKDGDDRGHLIGDQFDGSNGLENMIPQDANINRNDFKNFENELAKSVKEGNDVQVKVEPVYDGDSRRPSAIVVTYSINGEERIRIFPNE